MNNQLLPLCKCKPGWIGKYCHMEEAKVNRRIQVRKDLLSAIKDSFDGLLVTEAAVQQQALCVKSILGIPSELDVEVVEEGISHFLSPSLSQPLGV